MKPAPWFLKGTAWILLVRVPPARRADRVLPPDAPLGLSIFGCVDYHESDIGPYRELLVVPGRVRSLGGRRRWTVGRMFVSSIESLTNGRRNWGFPKQLAEFELASGLSDGREDRIVVANSEGCIAALQVRTSRLRLPVTTALIPQAARALVQRHDGTEYVFSPSARGWLAPARVLSWRPNPEVFPQLAGAKVLAAVKVVRFDLTVPQARTQPLPR